MAQNISFHSPDGNKGIARTYWVKVRLKSARAHLKSCSSLSDVEGLTWLHPSSPLCCLPHISLSLLGLPSIPLCSASWQMSHSSAISNILGSPVQLCFYFDSVIQLPPGLPAFIHKLLWRTWPGASDFLKEPRTSPWPFTLASFVSLKFSPFNCIYNSLFIWCFLGPETSWGVLSQGGSLAAWGLALKALFSLFNYIARGVSWTTPISETITASRST